ncbi:MAG: hypothetical protein WAZ14_01190 [Patescibacteria group bacterium]
MLLPFALLAGGGNSLSQSPINYADPQLVVAGQDPWGRVELRKAADGSIEGKLPCGNTKLQLEGTRIFGKSPWGSVDLTYANDRLSGRVPWGSASLTVSDIALTGKLPWGRIELRLTGQKLEGKLPWGPVHLRLGDHYNSLTDPDVLLAIAVLLADKT